MGKEATKYCSPRILHVVSTMKIGGLERQVYNLISVSSIENAYLVCMQDAGPFAERLEKLGYNVTVLDNSRSGIGKLWSLIQVILRVKPDIIHCHNMLAFLYGKLAAMILFNKKTVMSKHGEAFPGRKFSQKVALYLLRYTEIVVVSQAIKEKILRLVKADENRITFIQNGIPLPGFSQQVKPADKNLVIGTVGRLAKAKRYDVLLRCFADVSQKFENLKLIIVGGGPEAERLEELSQKLGLSGSVSFAGEQYDVAPYYKKFDIFAMTSDTEGLPMVMLEAMSYGIPVISTDVGAIGDLFSHGENIVLAQKGDEEDWTHQLQNLIKNTDLRESIGNNGRSLIVSKYSSEKSLELHNSLYSRILGN